MRNRFHRLRCCCCWDGLRVIAGRLRRQGKGSLLHVSACFCVFLLEWAWWISQRVGAMGEAKQQGAVSFRPGGSVLIIRGRPASCPDRPHLDSTACPPGGERCCQVLFLAKCRVMREKLKTAIAHSLRDSSPSYALTDLFSSCSAAGLVPLLCAFKQQQ